MVTSLPFRGIDSFGWYNNLRTIIHKSQPNSLITLRFWSHHETFIRRSWYSVLPDRDVTISCHIKKTVVVGMTAIRFLVLHLAVDITCGARCGRSLIQTHLGCLPLQDFALLQDVNVIMRAATRISHCT